MRKQIIRHLLENAELMEESAPKEPVVELLGEGRVLIENHKGVTLYSGEVIQAKVGFGAISVKGSNLRLRLMTAEKLVIVGRICEIQVVRGCKK